MGIIAWVVLGLVAGWIASVIMKTNDQQGFLADIVIGVLGALVGGFAFNLIGGMGITGFNFYSLFVAVLGAIALLSLRRAI